MREPKMVRVKFSVKNIAPILRRDKWMTLRYKFERSCRPGDHIVMLTPDGEAFAKSIIEIRTQMRLRAFVNQGFDGHRKYENVDEAAHHLHEYYPGAKIGGPTTMDVLGWDPEALNVHPTYQHVTETA